MHNVNFRRHGFLIAVTGAVALVVAIGVAFPAVAVNAIQSVMPFVTCTSSNPCSTFKNLGAGPGAKSTSALGQGLDGETTFNSTSNATSVSGVIGQDKATTSTFNTGVLGVSTNGTGVKAVSNAGIGMLANSKFSTGVFGQTFNPSLTTLKVAYAVVGSDASTDGGALNTGVGGFSTKGYGMVGSSVSGTGVLAQGITALTLEPSPSGVNLLLGLDASFTTVATLDTSGNLVIKGKITTSGSCSIGCSGIRSGGEKRVVSYFGSQSRPTMEDFGEAQLVRGEAYVKLDPAFANVIDARTPYMVFLTPEGDTNGLYVTQRTSTGFLVREIHGGAGSIGFAYRIVARPFGDSSARLPMVTLQRHPH